MKMGYSWTLHDLERLPSHQEARTWSPLAAYMSVCFLQTQIAEPEEPCGAGPKDTGSLHTMSGKETSERETDPDVEVEK